MARLTHEQFKKEALADPAVKKSYDELEEEFALIAELIKARKMRNKTQQEVAKAMHTSSSAVSRLEAGPNSTQKSSPSVATLQRYAHALGFKLQIKLIPEERWEGY